MDVLSHYFISVIWGMDHGWQGWITSHTNEWPPTMPNESSPVTLVLSPTSLNHAPHQCCSDPMMMVHVRICYLTVLLVLYGACTTSDKGESPHIPQHDLQLHPGHTQLLPWFSDKRDCMIYLMSPIVAQGRWCRCGYAIPLFYECWYEVWTRSDRCGPPHIPTLSDLRTHPWHHQ